MQLQSSVFLTDDAGDAAAALVSAFECVQDADKARDSVALAGLLHSLGVTCSADLAHLDDADISSIKQMLKPAAAGFFEDCWFTICHAKISAKTLRCMRADALHASVACGPRDECFAYLQDASKHVDAAAMAALLLQLGISLPNELQHVDDAQMGDMVALLRPVAAKVFVRMMGYVRRGL